MKCARKLRFRRAIRHSQNKCENEKQQGLSNDDLQGGESSFDSAPLSFLSACGGGDSAEEPDGTTGAITGTLSKNYPYILGPLRVSFVPSLWTQGSYDVTVELDATGPAPIYSIGLWIHSKTNENVFDYLDLQNTSGSTTWSATTYYYIPLPPGEYYIDSIMLEDGADGLVRSGWYNIDRLLGSGNYVADQRLTDWSKPDILEYNLAVSNIPVATFKLP